MSCFLALLALGVFVGGIVLIGRGTVGRLVGHSPHCRKCGYDLTGLESDNCPECGRYIRTLRNVQMGRRIRRRSLIVIGVPLVLIGGMLVFGSMGRSRYFRSWYWYQKKPTAWVLEDAGSNSPTLQRRALEVLFDRQFRGELSAEELNEAAELLLRLHAVPAGSRRIADLICLTLSRWYDAGQLSAVQGTTFLENSLNMELDVRATVLLGEEIPVTLRCESRISHPLFACGELVVLRLDGDVVPVGSARWEHMMNSADVRSFPFQLPPSTAGRHRIEADIDFDLRRFNEAAKTFDVIQSSKRTLTAEFDVVTHRPADYITLVQPDGVDQILTERFVLRQAYLSSGFDWATRRSYPTLKVGIEVPFPLPAAIAFDAFTEFDGRSVSLGRLVAHADEFHGPWWMYIEGEIPEDLPPRVDIVLKPSREAAMETSDLREIWNREIRLSDVEISNFDTLEQQRERRERQREEATKRIPEEVRKRREELRRQAERARARASSSQPTSSQPVSSQPAAQPAGERP